MCIFFALQYQGNKVTLSLKIRISVLWLLQNKDLAFYIPEAMPFRMMGTLVAVGMSKMRTIIFRKGVDM